MTGRSPLRGSGLRPFGAEPQGASQAEPPVPNAAQIAQRLRPKERAALLGGKVSGGTKPSLLRQGLLKLTPRKQARPYSQQRYDYALTELGCAVVSIIERAGA